MTSRSNGQKHQRGRLLLASSALAAAIFVAALATLPKTFGYGALWFAAVPGALTVLVGALIGIGDALGREWPRLVAIVLCTIASLGVVTSFVLPLFALLPSCALLVIACAVPSQPAQAGARRRR